jgi:enoyl-CoA hydratase/carnithine racemase
MKYELVDVVYEGKFATITLNNPEKRNPLSLKTMKELTAAFEETGESDARGIILTANGTIFSSGHDFNDMAGQDLAFMRKLLRVCTKMMDTIQAVPQPVLAMVQGGAAGGGCQLVASCDLAVASSEAWFATPGGKGGWFCHTPMVAVSRNVGRKRVMEMLLTGEPISAQTAYEWGLVNRVVAPDQLHAEALALLEKATQGSALSKGFGKQSFYAQIDLDQPKAYAYAVEMMAATSQVPDAQERMNAFLAKKKAH